MSQANPLSDFFTLYQVVGRAEELCGEVEKGLVQRTSIVEVLKRKMIQAPTYGKGAFRKFFRLPATLPVAGDDTLSYDTLGVREVIGISVPDLTAIQDGDPGVYTELDSWEAFVRARKNSERATYGRYYYVMGGEKKAYLVNGGSVQAQSELTLVYECTPYVGFNDATVDDKQTLIDIPDFLVPFVETGTAVEALQQAGSKNLQGSSLVDKFETAMRDLNGMIQQQAAALKQTHQD